MNDIIKGPVLRVIDGDTFEMIVTHIGKQNKYNYNNIEKIRINGINAPEINSHAGKIAKKKLTQLIFSKTVQCFVQARDVYGRIVANVNIA